MPSTIRTRFAPSPTGTLHVGGARTALFSWLFAKSRGGSFVLRMEDTDAQRSTDESAEQVIRDLKWLGLQWDEGPGVDGPKGPYYQSQRFDIYEKYLEQLKADGLAYPTFETKEDVEAEREAAIASGQKPVYTTLEADAAEVEAKVKEGIKPAWRFRMPEDGVTEFSDLVHGRTRFENRLLNDIVIVRSDGTPTYNFAASIDDALMGITHIIRGDDHISNTPCQICLTKALKLDLPEYAHIPMILGPDKQRLSKRHGATAVGQYREAGYLPEAVVNYLALLGWSFDDKTTLFTLDELKEKFTLERVGKSAAVFDTVKMEWMSGVYIKEAELERVTKLAWEQYVRAGLVKEDEFEAKKEWFTTLVNSLKEKARTLSELPKETEFFFKDVEGVEDKALANYFKFDDPAWLDDFAAELKDFADFEIEPLEAFCRGYCAKKEMKFKQFVGPMRAALSGRAVTPGLFEMIYLLGKDKVIERIAASRRWEKP